MPDKQSLGRGAESLVKAQLEIAGYHVFTSSHSGTPKDLIAEDNEGNLISIQVKSFSTTEDAHDVDIRKPSAKTRHYGTNDFDVLALVDTNKMTVAFVSHLELVERKIKRSIRVWRRNKDEYETKTPYKWPPIFFEDYASFENAAGKEAI